MNYIKLPMNTKHAKLSIQLRDRRKSLGMTMQEVASAAHLQIQQYHRFEDGTRDIRNASLSVAVAVCLVLQIDPAELIPDAEKMNEAAKRLNTTVERKITRQVDERTIISLFRIVFERFNDRLGTSYSFDDYTLAFCTESSSPRVYKEFAEKCNVSLTKKETFEEFCVKLITTAPDAKKASGGSIRRNDEEHSHTGALLIRTDYPVKSIQNYINYMVRELSKTYCMDYGIYVTFERIMDDAYSGTQSEFREAKVRAGIKIWNALIIEMICDSVFPSKGLHIQEIKTMLELEADMITVGNDCAANAMYRYLSAIMCTVDVKEAGQWAKELPFQNVIRMVYDQLHVEQPYRVRPDFIARLGEEFMLARIENTTREDLMEYMAAEI